MPWVQPCEGSPRSAACTASRSVSLGWKGSPGGRPSAARRTADPPGRSYPVVVWWWSMAATRHRWVAGADAHSIMRQTGHRSPVMLEVYAREHAPLVGNAVTRLGL